MSSFYKREWNPIGCVAIIILAIGVLILEGWIASLLWNWIVPTFWSSAPILNTWQALGAMIVLDIVGCLLFRGAAAASNT